MNVLTPYPDLSPLQLQQLLEIEIRPEQKMYSGDVDTALYTLLGCPDDDIQGFALLVSEVPRAFLLLKHGRFVPHWAHPQAATLHALQVHWRLQGRGLGRACLEALPDAARQGCSSWNCRWMRIIPRPLACIRRSAGQTVARRTEAASVMSADLCWHCSSGASRVRRYYVSPGILHPPDTAIACSSGASRVRRHRVSSGTPHTPMTRLAPLLQTPRSL
jgi:GNAT superfamily N-acetyltransferase